MRAASPRSSEPGDRRDRLCRQRGPPLDQLAPRALTSQWQTATASSTSGSSRRQATPSATSRSSTRPAGRSWRATPSARSAVAQRFEPAVHRGQRRCPGVGREARRAPVRDAARRSRRAHPRGRHPRRWRPLEAADGSTEAHLVEARIRFVVARLAERCLGRVRRPSEPSATSSTASGQSDPTCAPSCTCPTRKSACIRPASRSASSSPGPSSVASAAGTARSPSGPSRSVSLPCR